MRLEARARICFSDQYLLRLDGVPLGMFRTRCFSSTIDIRLIERRHLVFQKVVWLGTRWILRTPQSEAPLAESDRMGVFSSKWRLLLSSGSAEMYSGGWICARRTVRRGDAEIASVGYFVLCPNGWFVEEHAGLTVLDLLLIGLVSHVALGLHSAE